MSGLCSIHRTYHLDCAACNAIPRDLFPDWDKKSAEAKEAGLHKCENCNFVYYKTIDFCPKCEFKRKE